MLMGTQRWRVFALREARKHRPRKITDIEGDVAMRLHCNCRVLQRTNNYGLKLLQVGTKILRSKGCVIDIFSNGRYAPYYRLNTNSAKPQ